MKQIILSPSEPTSIVHLHKLDPFAIVGFKQGHRKYFIAQVASDRYKAYAFMPKEAPNRKCDEETGTIAEVIKWEAAKEKTTFYQFATGDELLNWLATHDNV